MGSYIYIHSTSAGCYTVGQYDPNGHFEPESDHRTEEEAAKRVRYLNGGTEPVETPTLRDYFAAAALTGLLAMDGVLSAQYDDELENYDSTATQAYDMADAMLEARKN